MSGPATGRRQRAGFLRALSACLVLSGVTQAALDRAACAQALTSDLMNPIPEGFLPPRDSLLRRVDDTAPANPPASTPPPRAPAGIGTPPVYGVPAADGASDTGYDSLN